MSSTEHEGNVLEGIVGRALTPEIDQKERLKERKRLRNQFLAVAEVIVELPTGIHEENIIDKGPASGTRREMFRTLDVVSKPVTIQSGEHTVDVVVERREVDQLTATDSYTQGDREEFTGIYATPHGQERKYALFTIERSLDLWDGEILRTNHPTLVRNEDGKVPSDQDLVNAVNAIQFLASVLSPQPAEVTPMEVESMFSG